MTKQFKPSAASVSDVEAGVAHPSARRVTVFRVVAGFTGVMFLFLGISNALAPWVATTANPNDSQPELHRWFTAMSGSDVSGAVCLLALAIRPKGRELLALYFVAGFAIAALIIVPFSPAFIVLLLVFVPVLATYPYRSDLAPRAILQTRAPLAHIAVAAGSAVVLLVTAALALGKQIGGTDSAARAGWWVDYTEHAVGLALISVFAVSRQPGWRLLCGMCSISASSLRSSYPISRAVGGARVASRLWP